MSSPQLLRGLGVQYAGNTPPLDRALSIPSCACSQGASACCVCCVLLHALPIYPATPTPTVRRAHATLTAARAGEQRSGQQITPVRGTSLRQPLAYERGRVVYTFLRPLPVPRLLALHPAAGAQRQTALKVRARAMRVQWSAAQGRHDTARRYLSPWHDTRCIHRREEHVRVRVPRFCHGRTRTHTLMRARTHAAWLPRRATESHSPVSAR